MNNEALKAAGIDLDDALARVMGNEVLLEYLLQTYSNDTQFSLLKDALATHSEKQTIESCHTLKGMCSNLSMTTLTELFTKQLEYLRSGNWDEACNMMPEIEQAQTAILAAIQE